MFIFTVLILFLRAPICHSIGHDRTPRFAAYVLRLHCLSLIYIGRLTLMIYFVTVSHDWRREFMQCSQQPPEFNACLVIFLIIIFYDFVAKGK